MIKILTEEEKSNISSQHDEIDRNLLNFLIRRIKINKRKLNTIFNDVEPLEVTEYFFEGLPSYGFNSFDSKKDMENKLIEMLYENNITKYVYDMNTY